jgi:hypothetical protein
MRLRLTWIVLCAALIAACGGPAPSEDGGTDVPTADRAMADVATPSDAPAPIDAQPDVAQADVPTPIDAMAADASSDVPRDAGGCSLPGTYSLTFMGMTAFFRFTTSGTWQGAQTLAALDAAPAISGTYTLMGNRITLVESGAGSTSCPAGAMGVYDITFNATCAMSWGVSSDVCASRAMVLASGPFTRVL